VRDALLAICITCPAGEWRANLSYPELEFKAAVVRTHADRAIEGEYLRPKVSLPHHAAIDRDTHLAALHLRAQGVGVATTKWGDRGPTPWLNVSVAAISALGSSSSYPDCF
jgi:hypothetical protein